uniref:Uncharacterized protein n=1 Tax=Bionectria ochroleuca TaxID=29856 RepID=A0A8H7NG06_BIOOC
MAFRQPTLQSMQRAVKPAAENRESAGEQSQAQRQLHQPLDQSQTWVLFAPATEGATTASDFSETIPSIQTTGRLQLSDIGSIHTAARSTQINNDERGSNLPSEIEEEDAELDRLDSHLPSFRSFPREEDQNMDDSLFSNPVFPQHDGLGLFNIGQPALGLDAQDQMYQFEKYNPRRVHLRRESLDLANQELDSDRSQEAEKRQRIEAWRLEHSRVLVEEIQRQTRRRRRSQASLRQVQTFHTTNDEHVAVNAESISDNLTWHDDDADVSTGEPDGLLARVTQKVIKDLLGIDDHLLSILFGESFPEDETLSSTPRALHLGDQVPLTPTDEHSWHERVANTVSREIGLLVNQISHHPGAFSSYSRIHQQPLPYAGLPVIPETGLSQVNDESTVSLESEKTLGQDFRPTIQRLKQCPKAARNRQQSKKTHQQIPLPRRSGRRISTSSSSSAIFAPALTSVPAAHLVSAAVAILLRQTPRMRRQRQPGYGNTTRSRLERAPRSDVRSRPLHPAALQSFGTRVAVPVKARGGQHGVAVSRLDITGILAVR